VDAISGEFKPPEVASTLWAYETIERKSRERMMGQMQRRVETISGISAHIMFQTHRGLHVVSVYAKGMPLFIVDFASLLVFESDNVIRLTKMCYMHGYCYKY
jgi:hypothetical protein